VEHLEKENYYAIYMQEHVENLYYSKVVHLEKENYWVN
jgi:hypothetical protein